MPALLKARNAEHPVSPFDPATVPGMVLWLDWSDPTAVYVDAGSTLVSADGDLIYRARDKSGNGNHADQATSGARARYTVDVRARRPAARFDGANATVINMTLSAGTSGTYFFVATKRSAPGAGSDLCTRSGGVEFGAHPGYSATDYWYYPNQAGGVEVFTGATVNAWSILGFRHPSAASAQGYYNGVPVGAVFDPGDVITSATTFNLALGGDNDFDLATVMYFNTALSPANHNAIGHFLSARFALPWTEVV